MAAFTMNLQTLPETKRGDPKALEIGTRVNLRRGFPGSAAAARDIGWTITGYTANRKDIWVGYALTNDAGEKTTASKAEAMDVVNAPPEHSATS